MTFLLAGITLDVAQVLGLVIFLLDSLDAIDLAGWMISSLVSVAFFGVLGLRLISSRIGMGPSFFLILRSFITVLTLAVSFVLLGQQRVALRALRIDLPNVRGGLQVGFCFYITCLLHHFFPQV